MLRVLSPGWLAFLGSLLALAGLGGFIRWYSAPNAPGPSATAIIVHCADALRAPMESIAKAYELETGQPVELRVNASQSLLAQMELSHQGDLYLPADDSYLDMARAKKLIREVLPMATMGAVVVVNPSAKKITKWADLLTDDCKLILANPAAAAIGKVTRDELRKTGRWADIEKRKPTFQGKISDVASAVLLHPKGAGIVWDAVAGQFPKLTVVRLPELAGIRSHVGIAVTSFSKQPTDALRFARYASAKDKGLMELSKRSYTIPEVADVYDIHPQLRLSGGSMLRPALEETIKEFQRREGVTIHTNWNGCGILVAEMQTKKIPDIYFACEPRFMEKVQELFEPPEIVSSNRLVIAVRKGNPREIRALKDLSKDDLKVGVGYENQCALGDLTKMTFIRTGLYARLQRNIAKQAPSGDLLISDFRGGALDVIVCYESNVTPYLDEFEFTPVDIGVDNRDCTNPLQPVAIRKDTAHPQLARRLMEAFQSVESRARFEKLGFGWVKK